MSHSAGAGGRAQPFYCPYCGEEDFTPYGEEAGAYLCGSCNRHYQVKFLGLDASSLSSSSGEQAS